MIASATQTRTDRTAGQIALIVAGALAALLALAMLAGGGVLLWAHGTKRDAAGFYGTSFTRLATPTYALASEGLNVGTDGPNWLFRGGRLGTVRVTATGTQAHPVFVGIAREAQVSSYLESVAHDAVTDFEIDPFSVTYARRSGDVIPAAPVGQKFWAVEATGSGQQTVTWGVKKGRWAVVVMNADASRGVRTDVSVGAKVPLLFWLGIGLLGAGGLVALGGGAAIYFAVRTRRAPTLTAPA